SARFWTRAGVVRKERNGASAPGMRSGGGRCSGKLSAIRQRLSAHSPQHSVLSPRRRSNRWRDNCCAGTAWCSGISSNANRCRWPGATCWWAIGRWSCAGLSAAGDSSAASSASSSRCRRRWSPYAPYVGQLDTQESTRRRKSGSPPPIRSIWSASSCRAPACRLSRPTTWSSATGGRSELARPATPINATASRPAIREARPPNPASCITGNGSRRSPTDDVREDDIVEDRPERADLVVLPRRVDAVREQHHDELPFGVDPDRGACIAEVPERRRRKVLACGRGCVAGTRGGGVPPQRPTPV